MLVVESSRKAACRQKCRVSAVESSAFSFAVVESSAPSDSQAAAAATSDSDDDDDNEQRLRTASMRKSGTQRPPRGMMKRASGTWRAHHEVTTRRIGDGREARFNNERAMEGAVEVDCQTPKTSSFSSQLEWTPPPPLRLSTSIRQLAGRKAATSRAKKLASQPTD